MATNPTLTAFEYQITSDDENAETFVRLCEGLMRDQAAVFVPMGSIGIAPADGAEGTVDAGAFESSAALSAEDTD